MTRRATLVLAMLAALCGAPSPLSAAPPNRLVEPTAVPGTGTVLTTFSLSVRYASSGGNAASRVVATIGRVNTDLTLVSGTETEGTWAGAVRLPVGSWPVTFRAVVQRGPQPQATGPTLVVAPHPSAEPTPAGSGAPAPSDGSAAPSPGRAPREEPPSPEVEPKAAATAAPTATADDEPAPARGRTGSGGRRGEAPATGGSPGPTRPGGAQARPGSQPATGSGEPGAGMFDGGTGQQDVDDLLLVLGIVVGVAAATLVGTGWMLAARTKDDEPRRGTPARAAAIEARRRARATGHDPVLAGMGLEDHHRPPGSADG